MVDCLDFLEWLGPDASYSIFTFLDDPTDLVRASAVSRSWCRFVIVNGFIKSLCSRKFPEVSNFCHTWEVSSSKNAEVGSSSDFEWVNLQKEHRIFSALCHFIISSKFEGDCIRQAICASSTDNIAHESIENTLESYEFVDGMPSYWSSGGQDDPEVPETLLYRLTGNLCVVNEIKIRPFQATFQQGHPIYSAKFVRFRMGSWLRQGIIDGHEDQQLSADDSYHWTYVSPEFPMTQENVLQSFILPRPVICIGGILQIELIGRVQKQEVDGLYYICICHVTVVGGSLAPVFDIGNLEAPASMTLKYMRDSNVRALPKGAETTALDTSPWHTLRALINFGSNRGWNPPLLGTLLPRVHSSDEEEDYADDSDDDLYLPE